MDARGTYLAGGREGAAAVSRSSVAIDVDGVLLSGDLVVPRRPLGVVLFAHGSGSSRLSPRNRFVAGTLHSAAIGTLLFDLLTPGEETDRANVFDIRLLGSRLVQVARWLAGQPEAGPLRQCLFGASTGAAAALYAAAELGEEVAAVVSRGGRPDLAAPWLASVRSPTLLIVGGRDTVVLELNQAALAPIPAEKRLVVVPDAGHLFEERGALEQVALLARDWMLDHLVNGRAGTERS
jgi:putative phosphoribosyl transferase